MAPQRTRRPSTCGSPRPRSQSDCKPTVRLRSTRTRTSRSREGRRARALYVTAREQRVVLLRAFVKKTEKTPTGEIEVALQRAKELKP
ncbi:MAG: hypothetical protein EHM91_15910 [Planctomycetota bacterium]|nr:MAG: hypothetical protein EHM91_15910 [Planctomycetota bacterium]